MKVTKVEGNDGVTEKQAISEEDDEGRGERWRNRNEENKTDRRGMMA